MPASKTPKKTPVAPTPVPPVPAEKTAEQKRDEHYQNLQKPLNFHKWFVYGLWSLLGLGLTYKPIIEPSFQAAGYYLSLNGWPAAWQLGYNPLVGALKSLIFGSQTSSGLPVALVKGILPAFMAPFAVYITIGLPLVLLAYQLCYQNFTEKRFAGNASNEALKRDKLKGTPAAADSDEPDASDKPGPAPVAPIPTSAPATPSATKAPEAPKEAAPKKSPAKGSARAITPARNNHAKSSAAKTATPVAKAPVAAPATKRKNKRH